MATSARDRPRFGVFVWLAWSLTVLTTCSAGISMPMVVHDMAAPSELSFGSFGFGLGLLGTSAMLRFVALPRSIASGAVRAGSFHEFVQLGFCWGLALLALGAGISAAKETDSFDPVWVFAGLALLLVMFEVPSRQRARR